MVGRWLAFAVLLVVSGASAVSAQSPAVPPPIVPGGCTEPADAHRRQAGCYLETQLRLATPPADLSWQIYRFRDVAQARAESARIASSVVTTSHGGVWLQVLGDRSLKTRLGRRVAIVGPLRVPARGPVTARFIESDFPAGMHTRVHSHPGPEAFFVVSGVQCVETPTRHKLIHSGETYVAPGGPHFQASPTGRRSLVLVLHTESEPWSTPRTDWTPGSHCNG